MRFSFLLSLKALLEVEQCGGDGVWRASCSLMRGEQCQTSGNSFSKGIYLFEFENDSEFSQ